MAGVVTLTVTRIPRFECAPVGKNRSESEGVVTGRIGKLQGND